MAALPPHMSDSTVFARLRQCAPPSNACFNGPTRVHTPDGILIDSAVFAQLTADAILYNGPILPPSNGRSAPPSNTYFLGPIQVHIPNNMSIGSAVFAGLTIVTDRPTDRQTDHSTRSVTIGRIYVRSTAMRPSNTKCNCNRT